MNKPSLIATGMAVGLDTLPNFAFDPNEPFRACCICGRVFQSNLDRQGIAPDHAKQLRDRWATQHANTHSPAQHAQLRLSGQSLTPEAAQRLAAYGLIDLIGLTQSEEHADAYATARSVPENDADGT